MCSCGRGRSTQAIAVPIRPTSLDESAATSSLASPIGCRHSCRDAQAASVQDGQKAAVPSRSVLMSYCAETNRGQGLEGSGGWLQVGSRWAGGQASEGLQRSCSTAASAGVVVFACLCLCSADTHYCASKCGMVHTHCGMPSRACVSIPTKAQIKSNQVLHTILKAHFTTRHPSNDNTSTPKNAHKQTS